METTELSPAQKVSMSRAIDRLSAGENHMAQGHTAEMLGESFEPKYKPGKMVGALGESIFDAVKNPKVWIPAAIGLGVSAMALGAIAPGYSTHEMANPEIPDSRSQNVSGNLLASMFESTKVNDSFPVDPNKVIPSEAIVSMGQPGRMETTINNLSQVDQIRTIMDVAGLGGKQVYIQDNRRPVTKNLIDQNREH